MPRNLSIRARLLVLLSAPLVLLLIAAVILNVGFINGALQSRRVAVFASSAGGASQLISILQNERLVTVRSLVPGANVDPAELTAARAKTDAAIQAVIKGVGTGNIAGIGPSAKAELTAGYAALASFSGGRAAVDSGNTTAAQTLTGFGAYMDAYSDLSLAVSDDVKDRVMAREEAAFAYLIKEREAASREQAAGLLILSGANSTSVSQIRSNAVAEQNFLGTQAKLVENASLAADVGKVVNTSAAAQARALVASDRNAFSAAGNGTPTVTIDEWMKSTDAVIDSLDKAANVAASYVEDRGETSASDAIFRGVLLGVLTLLVAGGAIAFALRSATGIARRLRALAGAATEVRDELPRMVERMQTPGEGPGATFTPVPVTSNDEIGAVAHVINDLNETTFRIAGEQAALRASIAEMFVNVARRDQSLLARQLAFLDQLERTEENPDTLEDLFTLDHLATRMRRNAESLLVLAGINTGRRLRRPLPLSDVVRTAAGEIEFYDRVDLSLQVDPPVVGHLALTLSHLIAELLENSTRFSDPGSRVVVATSETDRGVEVSITDTGLGMNAEELEAANSRISGGRASEIVGAQRLGFYVVGRLAGRLDVEVRIDTAEGQGTKVTLLLLAPLFTPGSVRGGQPGLAALDAGRPAIERGPSGGSDVVPSALPDEAHPASAPGALPSRTAARAARQPAADTSTTAKVEGPSTIVSNPLAAEGLGDALSATLEQSAANQAVTGPTPTSTAPGRNLPSRRKRGGQEAPAAAPVAPGTGDETAFTPVTAPATGGSMPKRERQAEAPNARAAAEDILPRAGRKPRPVRESATPPQTAAEAFWTARKSTEKGATPVGRSALDAQPESVVETSGTPSPVSDTSVQAAPEQPVAQSAPAAAPVEAPTPRPVVDALRQRSALAAEALSALTEGHSFSPSMGSGSQPLVRRQAGATEAGAKPAPVRVTAAARQRRAPADVRSMLSGFQAGVSRGRAGDNLAELDEDGGDDGNV